MTRQAFLLGIAFIGFPFASEAADQTKIPDIVLDGSLPIQYSDNVTRVMSNKESDFYFSPYFKVSATGEVSEGVRYSLYASAGMDTLYKYTDSDLSNGTLGFQLKKRWDALEVGGFFERNYYFNKLYDGVFDTANDIGFFVRYNYIDPTGNWKIRPGMTITTRTTDTFAVERDLFHFKVDFERRLADRWWIFLTPRLRIYDYVDRSSGRIDAISSIGTGIRYEVTENIDLTSSIAYESRASGVAGRNYNNMIAGVSLDFSFDTSHSNRDFFETFHR